jgi:hypothetical protein
MCDPRQSIDAEAADVCAARSLPSLIQTRGGRLGPAWPRTDFEDSLRYPSLYYYAEGQPSHPASHLFSRCVCVCVLVAFSVVLPACEQQFKIQTSFFTYFYLSRQARSPSDVVSHFGFVRGLQADTNTSGPHIVIYLCDVLLPENSDVVVESTW